MKNKKWHLILIGLVILTSLNIFGETKKLRDIGRYRFIPVKPDTPAPEMMKLLLEKYAGDIQSGFEVAGSPELYSPFMESLKQAAYTEGQLAVGDKMVWMIFRSQGQIKVIRDLEWAGQEPLPIYSFSVLSGGQKYMIIMPKTCGNISLQRVEPAPAAEQEPAPAAPVEQKPEDLYEITKAKIYRDLADLINEVDLYCSFSVWEDEIPELRIIGAERESEKAMFSDGDLIYLNKGKNGGLEPGQIFLVKDIRDGLGGYGPLALGKGRARIQYAGETTSVAVVENSCGDVRSGHYLIPFEPKEGMTGKDLGYDVVPEETEGVKGQLFYLQGDLRQLGSGMWALLDLGAEQGLQVGQQLILYRRTRAELPIQVLGNCLVIDAQSRTSTVKVLSCRDVLRDGDLVMERPSR
jgi:hypothetical protein